MNKDLAIQLKAERADLVKQLKDLEEFIKRENSLRNKIAAIDGLLFFYENKNGTSENIDSASNGHSSYDKNLVWEEKCLFVLKEIGIAYASEVADKIRQYEPSLKSDRVTQAASFYLSKLLKEGRIKKVGQTGRKYKFSLN